MHDAQAFRKLEASGAVKPSKSMDVKALPQIVVLKCLRLSGQLLCINIYFHAYLRPSKLPWQISPKLWSVIIISTQTSLSLLCSCTILADDTRVIFKFIV